MRSATTLVLLLLCTLFACSLIQPSSASWSTECATTSSSDTLYLPPSNCNDPDIRTCVTLHNMCKVSREHGCNHLILNCTEEYVACINSVFLESTTSLEDCPDWGSETKVAIAGIAGGATYNGSTLEQSCFKVVCDAYEAHKDTCTNTTTPWYGPQVCQGDFATPPPTTNTTAPVPSTDAPTPSLLPTSTPVPEGLTYHFTLQFQNSNTTEALQALAQRLNIPYNDINIVELKPDGRVEIEFTGPSGGLATQQMLGIQGDDQKLQDLGITSMSSAAVDAPTPAPGPVSSDDDDDNTYLIVIIVVCSILGIVLIVGAVMFAKKKHDDSKLIGFTDYVGMVDDKHNAATLDGGLMQSKSGRMVSPTRGTDDAVELGNMGAATTTKPPPPGYQPPAVYSQPVKTNLNTEAVDFGKMEYSDSFASGGFDSPTMPRHTNPVANNSSIGSDPFDRVANERPQHDPLPLNSDIDLLRARRASVANNHNNASPNAAPRHGGTGRNPSLERSWQDDPDL